MIIFGHKISGSISSRCAMMQLFLGSKDCEASVATEVEVLQILTNTASFTGDLIAASSPKRQPFGVDFSVALMVTGILTLMGTLHTCAEPSTTFTLYDRKYQQQKGTAQEPMGISNPGIKVSSNQRGCSHGSHGLWFRCRVWGVKVLGC